MRRRFLLLGLLAAPIAATATAQGDDGWETVVAPDLHCRLEMPKPVTKSTAAKKEQGNASLRLAWESRRADQIFDFDYVDYEPGWFTGHDTKAMAKALGRGDAEKAFPRNKFKYVRDEPATLQGWDGYALDIEDAQGALVMMRTYIVKDRLFRLLVTAKNSAPSKADAQRFLDSLRLAETRPS
jgi:hypothetical protein